MASKKNDDLNEFCVNGSINYYDKHRSKCTAEDKKLASMMGSCGWNIVTNKEEHEVYFRNARNPDHFVDDGNQATADWWNRKRRVRRPGSDETSVLDSRMTVQTLTCPPTAGKIAEKDRQRTMKSLCQNEAPLDFGRFTARKAEMMPSTPEKNWNDKQVRDQHRKRDIPTPHHCNKAETKAMFMSRRDVPRITEMPPPAAEMFCSVDQLRSEPHTNVMSARFAHEHTAARMSGSQTARLTVDDKRHRSHQRLESMTVRDVTSWPWQSDKLTRRDPYHVKPMQASGNSSVKHDIISNERRNFWY
jgi:hypothetical protein